MDDLADAIGAAYDEASKEPSDAGQGGAPERIEPEADKGTGADEAAQRARDDAGRFAKTEEKPAVAEKSAKVDGKDKPREKLTLKPGAKDAAKEQERAEGQQAAAAEVAESAAKATTDAVDKPGSAIPAALPPAHWNGQAKIDWQKLPAGVKETLTQEYAAVAKLRELGPAIDHFAPALMQRFGNVTHGVGSILNTWASAVQNPVDFARQFCQQYNIDPQTLVAGGTSQVHGTGNGFAEQQAADPVTQELQRINAELQQLRQQPLIAQQQQQSHQINTDIQSFAAAVSTDGNLAHPYFNDVREHMGALMQTSEFTNLVQSKGGPAALNEAYDRAVYANPQIRQNLMAQNEQRQAMERKRAAETAKNASVSIAGAPGGNRQGLPSNETIDQTLRRVFDDAYSGRRV